MLDRWRERRANFKEFDEAGIIHMRRAVEASIAYGTKDKNKDAVLWVHRYDNWYPRMAFFISTLSLIVSVGALLGVLFKGRGCN